MSDFYQPGQHPDADQLNAFAEDALSAHEREQTLAHLAGCADCRLIVSLALPPVDDVPQPHPVAERRPWFSWLYGWNVAWLAGAGLAALIFLTVHVRNSGRDAKLAGGAPTQTAEVHPTAPPPVPPPAPALEPPVMNAVPAAVMKAPPPPVPRVAASSETLKAPADGAEISNQQIANLPLDGRRFIAQPQQQQQQAQQQDGALHGSVFGGLAGAGVGGPIARGNQSPFAQGKALNGSDKDVAQAAAAAPALAMPAPAASPQPPVLNAQAQQPPASAAKPVPRTNDMVTVNAGGMEMGTTNSSASTTLDTEAVVSLPRLPSHLGIASTITHGDQVLALDTAGTLFVSTNGGRQWKRVAAQWPGRAVKVELASLSAPAKQPSSFFLDGNDSGSALSTLSTKSLAGASVSGVVTDTSGAIVPAVSLTITDTRTGVARTTTSDRNGHYAVGGLTPDAYRVDASAPGFYTQRTTITLAAAQQSVVNLSLHAGSVNATVEVNAAPPMMDTKEEKRTRKLANAAHLSEPSAVFAITTDGGEIWTSADGKNWTRK